MNAPAIAGYDAQHTADFHRSVLRALNWGDANGECKPAYKKIERDLVAISRADGQPFSEDQLADLECELAWCAHGVIAANEGRCSVVTIRRAGDAVENARGDRFLATLRGESLNAQRFAVLTAGEFIGRKRMDWLVRGVLPRAEIGLLIAPWGEGKTFTAIDLAAAVQRGLPDWFGHRVKRGRVCIVAAEGAVGMQARFQAYMKHHDVSAKDMPSVVTAAPNLTNAKDVSDLIAALQAAGNAFAAPEQFLSEEPARAWDLVVVDTLAATTPGADENAGKDMGAVLANCKKIHQGTGALVLLVGHTGKDPAKGTRGWSGLEGNVDAIIELKRDGDLRTWSTRKVKDGRDDIKHSFRLKIVPLGVDEDGEPITQCVVEPTEAAVSKHGRRRKRPSGVALLVLQTMETKYPTAAPLIEELREAMQEQLEASVEKPGRATEYLKKAIAKLTDTEKDKWLYRHSGGRISLHPIEEAAAEEFDA